jgi:DNA (cytosine-5)-methyltransferase 1
MSPLVIQAEGVFYDHYKWGFGMNGLALFAGVSGLELGIKRLFPQSRIICYVEGEAYAASVLVSKMEKGILHEAPIWSNVETFDGSIFSGKVDFISAGFPCQPWSKAGKLKKTEDKRWLWHDIERIICETTPSFIFLENVPGLINGGIDPVLASLAKMGFDAEWGCLKVSEIGGNHHRDRLFIFAYNPETWGHFSDSNRDGFDSRWYFNENSGERISLQGGMEGDQPSSMRQIISNAECFLNGNRRIHNDDKKSISARQDKSSRSNRNKSRLQSSEKEGGYESNFSNTNGERLERGKEIGNPGKIGKESYQFNSRLSDIFGGEWWQTEPTVGRVAHGMADRVDRLRACGNGVVPYQAYRAYSELIKRADQNMKKE